MVRDTLFKPFCNTNINFMCGYAQVITRKNPDCHWVAGVCRVSDTHLQLSDNVSAPSLITWGFRLENKRSKWCWTASNEDGQLYPADANGRRALTPHTTWRWCWPHIKHLKRVHISCPVVVTAILNWEQKNKFMKRAPSSKHLSRDKWTLGSYIKLLLHVSNLISR